MKKLLIIFLLCTAASASIFINSFNSGQLSKDLKVRHDLDKTSMGSETLQNILVRPQGMAFKRPGTEYIADFGGIWTPLVPEVPTIPEVPDTYKYTYISEDAVIWGIPLRDQSIAYITAGPAVNVGGGIVGITYDNASEDGAMRFVSGDVMRFPGTSNYAATAYTLTAGTTVSQLQFTAAYQAETFDGTEIAQKLISMQSSNGRMDQDSTGNLYYGHNWDAGNNTYVTKIATDGTKVYGFLNHTWAWGNGSCLGLEVSFDDAYIYLAIQIGALVDKLEKYELATGDLVWSVSLAADNGYDLALDASGNVYLPYGAFGVITKYAAANGAATTLTTCKGIFSVSVDDGLSIVVAGGYQYQSGSPTGLYNLAVRTLDDSTGDTVAVGGTYLDGAVYYTYRVGTGQIALHDGYIYVLIGTGAATSEIYKYQWTGSSLVEISMIAGPEYGVGLYFDLWDNLVVVNQDWVTPQDDILWFYDSSLNYISKIEGMYTSTLQSWDAITGGAWVQGNAVFNGELGTPEIPGTPAVPGSWSYSGFDPSDMDNVRLIPFEYSTSDAYVLEFGHETISFLRTTP